MSMFDYIRCEMPLPEWPEGMKQCTLQTKSFDSPCMNDYEIGEDGILYLYSKEFEYQKNDSVTGIAYRPLPAKRHAVTHFGGVITFYHYYNHPNYTYDKAYAFEIGNIYYEVEVKEGVIGEIRCVSKVEPRELSDEEIKENVEKYREQVKANRERMIQYRKENPSPSQKLVDDLSDIISPKTAITDVSDYIKIINEVEKRIKEWRVEHDPWFFHEK